MNSPTINLEKPTMRPLLLRILLAALTAGLLSMPLAAQDLRYVRRTGGYGAFGYGGGNFTLTCDSGCAGDQLSAPGGHLTLGRHLSPRVRAELGLVVQNNSGEASNSFGASLGAAFYLVGNLYVRGGATYQSVNFEDTLGTVTGSGFPGFVVGAGYDLYLGRIFALTPYINYSSTSLNNLDREFAGGATVSTPGSFKSLNFGISASWIRGTWECTNRAGERIRVTRGNRDRATACLREVEARLGQRPSGVKY